VTRWASASADRLCADIAGAKAAAITATKTTVIKDIRFFITFLPPKGIGKQRAIRHKTETRKWSGLEGRS
jgi:hypothetical protein